MKQSGANPWKLGLFVVLGFATCAGGLWWLGLQRFNRETFETITYFDESVNGLDIGAPVKMRGVRIGTVSEISFAADQRRVEVRSQIYRDVLRKLGLDLGQDVAAGTERAIPYGMRVQLAVTGLTGIRFLLVDFLDPQRFPEPALPFPPPPNYLPAAPSTLKSLEDGLIELLDELPGIAAGVDELIGRLNSTLGEVDVAGLSERARGVLDRLDEKLAAIDLQPLIDEGLGTLQDARALLQSYGGEDSPLASSARRWESLAARLEAELGEAELGETSRSLRETAASFRALAHEAGGLSGEVRASLTALEESLRALRALADYVERDPGAFLRGRSGG